MKFTEKISLGNLQNNEKLFISMLTICFIKLAAFSAIIKAPAPAEWSLLPTIIFTLSNISALAIILSPILIFRSRLVQFSYGLTVNLLITFLILANRIYYMFFQSFISLNTVMHAHEGLSMYQAVLSTVGLAEVLWFIDMPILLYLYLKAEDTDTEKARFIGIAALSIVLLLTTNIAISHSEGEKVPNVTVKEQGVLLYYSSKLASYNPEGITRELTDADQERIENWFSKRRGGNANNQLSGIAQNKNLIVLQVEALQNIVIGKEVNGQEITPNINSIIDNSIYFEQIYDQVDMATADAEVLANLSLYPLNNVSVYMMYPENEFNSLANTLKRRGYETAAFHGHYGTFYNREEAYPNMGFDTYYSRDDYEQDEIHNQLLGDKTFLNQTADMLKNLDEPFYSFIITLTSHHPFNYVEDYEEIDVTGYENTIVGDYLKSIHYTDAAIGQFYGKLKEEGIMENSLLVIFGDHVAFNYHERDIDSINQFFGADMRDPLERMSRHKVPLIIQLPDSNVSKKVGDRGGMIDIFPTVSNLMGIENYYQMGRDLLNTDEETLILKAGSFIDQNKLYFAPTHTVYDMETGEIIEEHQLEAVIREVEAALDISTTIHQTDYFRHRRSD